jgi:hypothetical protein
MKKPVNKKLQSVKGEAQDGGPELTPTLQDIAKSMTKARLNPSLKRYDVEIENDLGGSIVIVKGIQAQTKIEAIARVKGKLLFIATESGKY